MIALFDSGVGGLSILREVQRLLPAESTVYLADTAHFPYGSQSEGDVCILSINAVAVLTAYHPQAIVVACNTASTSSLPVLREQYGTVPIVGVVPAIKPATEITRTKKIAVLATARTLESLTYQELKRQYADGVEVIDQPCPGWVELVEEGHVDDAQARQSVEEIIQPLVAKGVDTFVLGCTHYPFLRPLIEQCGGPGSHVLDSGAAVARQLQTVVATHAPSTPRQELYLCSGDPKVFSDRASRLLGRPMTAAAVALD